MKFFFKNKIFLTLRATFVILLAINFAIAQDTLSEQERTLNIIADFAERLCKDIPLKGTKENIELSGKAKVELSGFIKKLADLGVEGAAKYQKSEYEGVLQKDLVKVIIGSTNCRLQVWDDLKEKILSNSGPKFSPVTELPPYAIFDQSDNLRFSYGTFSTDNDCLDRLFLAQKQLDSYNAATCSRIPIQMWCLSVKNIFQKSTSRTCSKTKKTCMETLMLYKMESEIGGGKLVMTACESVPWNQLNQDSW